MEQAIFLVIGLVVGAALGWLAAVLRGRAGGDAAARAAAAEALERDLREQLSRATAEARDLQDRLSTEAQARTAAETRVAELGRQFEQQRALLAEAEARLKESFQALSAEVLKANAEQYTAYARKTLETVLAEAKGDLGKRQEAIQTLVQPLTESLKRYDEQTRNLEQARQKALTLLEQEVRTLATTSRELQQETGRLVTSLRDPKVRGRWGEIALRRAAELAGMVEHCDFEQQVTVDAGEGGRMRPDMVVHLPGGRTVVVDAKAVLDAYLDAVAAADEAARAAALARHASQVRSRIRELSGKAYWNQFTPTPEFVVLFLPGESFFSAAAEADASLLEDALASGVVIASPTTLIALLKAVAYGWKQQQIAENAQRISDLGRELHDRIRTFIKHIADMGGGLEKAVASYNKAVGSLETRLLPSARRFRDLGAADTGEIAELEAIDQVPRLPDSGAESQE